MSDRAPSDLPVDGVPACERQDGASACTIRFAREPDIPALVELLQDLFEIEAGFRADPAKQARGLRLLMANPVSRIWVAEEENRVVGMCTLQTMISTAEGGVVSLIEDVIVRADRRGSGVGTRLLVALEAWAIEQGHNRLQLLADRNNRPALAFYRKLGFQDTCMIAQRKFVPETDAD